MNYDYLAKIQAEIQLHTTRVTSNLLDGEFRSIYRGRSLEFDDLKEYSQEDSVRDIDWKSSSKAGKTLVRRYVADKKHNVLFIADSGLKMLADSSAGEPKKDLALNCLAATGYIIDRHGDDIAFLSMSSDEIDFVNFQSGMTHLQKCLSFYERDVDSFKLFREESPYTLKMLMTYALEHIRKHMMIFVITDFAGLDTLDDELLAKLTINNDVFVFNIDDAYYTSGHAFDMDENRYVDDYLGSNRLLRALERTKRGEVVGAMSERCRRYRMNMETIKKEDDIIDSIVNLLEKHSHANYG
ncbi:MAG: DUF58 domain-containing protein [Lachnospiraceae bacterium]|nr:DUF58 domain-containing protein [Lachnospiraceae bacterium]